VLRPLWLGPRRFALWPTASLRVLRVLRAKDVLRANAEEWKAEQEISHGAHEAHGGGREQFQIAADDFLILRGIRCSVSASAQAARVFLSQTKASAHFVTSPTFHRTHTTRREQAPG
jgi:hypothetical protein